MTPPRFLFMHLYGSCNLRCGHCTFWQRPHTLNQHAGWQHAQYLHRREEILNEFASLNPKGAVVTHGGETMLDWDDYFLFCKMCRERSLKLLSVCNGTMIFSPERALKVVLDGPSEVSVSLDSPRALVHDAFRGVPGSFDKATRALRLLLEARRETGADAKIYAILLLGKSTYEELDAAYDLVLRQIGADKLKLNAIQPSFGLREGKDEFFERESQVDPGRLEEILWQVNEKYDLAFSPRWVGQMVMYFRSLRKNPLVAMGWSADLSTDEHVCNSYDRNVWVSDRGVVQLCCDARWEGRQWEKAGDLAAFWGESGAQREAMGSCNRLCGISHSLRNTSSTLRATRHGE